MSIKLSEAVAGTRVVLAGPDDSERPRGVITSVEPSRWGGYSIKVNWDEGTSSWHRGHTYTLDQLTLESLELEFEAVREQVLNDVKEKIKQSSILVEEATDLLAKYGKNLSDFDDLRGPILGIVDNAGWSSSSIGC